MKKLDLALQFPNPRLLSAVYFGLLSVAGTLLINAFLSSLGVQDIVPLFQAVLLGMVVASGTGAIFGERLIHCQQPYKIQSFWIGFIMVIASLPVFALGLLYLMREPYAHYFPISQVQDMIYSYLLVLFYSYFIFGIFLAIAAGFAAMYLRGQIVYDVLHTDEKRQRRKKQALKHHEKEPVHR